MPRQTNHEWRQLAKKRIALGRASAEPCCLCGREIDYDAPRAAPWAATAEHYAPVSLTGTLIVPISELGVAHHKCQSLQGSRIANRKPSRLKLQAVPDVKPDRREFPEPLPEPVPRIFTPRHPDARGSLGPEWTRWLGECMGLKLRPWQAMVMDRALEIDADGRLVWRRVIVSTPRQSGKSYLIWAVNAARAFHSEYFGEVQECIHIANNLAAARRIHQRAWRFADAVGADIYRAMGNERLVYRKDGSHWTVVAAPAIWGWTASQATVDEAWNIPPEVVESALTPTLVEREQYQLWLFSTANDDATPLMLTNRERAMSGEARNTMIAEWSAPDGCDTRDPVVWRDASPYWTRQRFELMDESTTAHSFRRQWLNMWPKIRRDEQSWSEAWPTLPAEAIRRDLPIAVAAVETAYDRSSYGIAYAQPLGNRVVLELEVFAEEADALASLTAHGPIAVIAGASIAARFEGPWLVKPATAKETMRGTPWLMAAIRDGKISHNHDPEADKQVMRSAVMPTESGPTLSARNSKGSICAAKAAAWAGVAASEDWFGLTQPIAVW